MKLDVGCGNWPTGDVNLDLFPGKTVHRHYRALDVKVTPNFVKGDACRLPFKNEAFDTSFSSHTIEHVDAPVLLIKEMLRVTKMEVTITCLHKLGKFGKAKNHKNYFDKKWFIQTLNRLKVYSHQISIKQWAPLHKFVFFILFPLELEVKIKKGIADGF